MGGLGAASLTLSATLPGLGRLGVGRLGRLGSLWASASSFLAEVGGAGEVGGLGAASLTLSAAYRTQAALAQVKAGKREGMCQCVPVLQGVFALCDCCSMADKCMCRW